MFALDANSSSARYSELSLTWWNSSFIVIPDNLHTILRPSRLWCRQEETAFVFSWFFSLHRIFCASNASCTSLTKLHWCAREGFSARSQVKHQDKIVRVDAMPLYLFCDFSDHQSWGRGFSASTFVYKANHPLSQLYAVGHNVVDHAIGLSNGLTILYE